MVEIDLTDEERRTLIDILEGVLSDLRMEIADTDRLEFREMLKERKQILLKAVDALRIEATPADG